jgi:hypothetical protein
MKAVKTLSISFSKNAGLIPNIEVFSFDGNSEHKNVIEKLTLYFSL